MSELQVIMASGPDEDELVAEIWRGDDYVGDIRRRDERLLVALTPIGGRAEGIEIGELLEALTRARERLLGLQ